MKKIKKFVLMLAAAGVIGLFAACDTSSSSGGGEPEVTGDKFELTDAGIKLNGVLLEKTADTKVMKSEVTTAGSDFVEESASSDYKGVFINGRNITLSPFIMSKYQVTQELYTAVMTDQKVTIGETEYTLDAEPFYCKETGSYPIAEGEVQKYRPAENVTWYDAVYFCNALSEKLNLKKAYSITVTSVSSETNGHITGATVELEANANGYRLPTEAEWEFAARGGDSTKEAWNYLFSGAATGKVSTEEGAEDATYSSYTNTGLDSVGWYWYNICNNGETTTTDPSSGTAGYGTHEVGKKAANALGLFDMSGNVWEWCYDLYNSIETGDVTDPTGASSGSSRVERGGSWSDDAYDASVCYRGDSNPAAGASTWASAFVAPLSNTLKRRVFTAGEASGSVRNRSEYDKNTKIKKGQKYIGHFDGLNDRCFFFLFCDIMQLTAFLKQTGASSGSNRVKRGGSWNNNANNASVCNRNNNNPDNRNNNLGFRLCRSAQHNQKHGGCHKIRVYQNCRGHYSPELFCMQWCAFLIVDSTERFHCIFFIRWLSLSTRKSTK